MGVGRRLKRWIDDAGDWPGLRHWRRQAERKAFLRNRNENLFWGCFASHAEALAQAPRSRPLGYDNEASAKLYANRLTIEASDYPALFWIARSMEEGAATLLDFGGHIGIKYYAFRQHLRDPALLHWTVFDVPAVVAEGRTFASRRGDAANLHFADRVADLGSSDVLFLSGAHQYLDEHVGQLIERLAKKPGRVLLNTTPVHPMRSFHTLNSIGTAICPYQVISEADLQSAMGRLGYVLRDRWSNPGKRLDIPFEKECSLEHYSGYCFDLGQGFGHQSAQPR